MEYKCEIPVEGSEKRIISKLIKQVKKEWLIKEVVKSSPGFSVIYFGPSTLDLFDIHYEDEDVEEDSAQNKQNDTKESQKEEES